MEGMDIEIFSLHGAYMNPLTAGDFLRGVIPRGKFYQNLYSLAMQCDKDNIHEHLMQWCDVWLMTHNSQVPGQKVSQKWLADNWELAKRLKKKVIWRSIGQSTEAIEKELKRFHKEGLNIVRYSYKERVIPSYAGEDAMIRFSLDTSDFEPWQGEWQRVITIGQSFTQRGDHLGLELFQRITDGFQRKIFGTGNEDLGDLNGGTPSWYGLKEEMKKSRVFVYFGTVPASYTLGFMEALAAGIPVVAVGKNLRRDREIYGQDTYEVPELITNGVTGYVSDDITELRNYIQLLMEDHETARRIGEAGRKLAIELFDKKKIMNEWKEFLLRL